MSETHPNAFRVEADVKRAQAQQLINEANDLEIHAQQLEHPDGVPSQPETTTEQPAEAPPAEAKPEEKSGKLFSKK